MKRDLSLGGEKVFRFGSRLEIRIADILTISLLSVLGLVLAFLSVISGMTSVSISDASTWIGGGDIGADRIYALMSVRLPRIVLGFMVGFAVALSGAILQSLARNPLADPGLLGFSQGSMTAVMLVMVIVPTASKLSLGLTALAGGFSVALVLLLLVGGERSGGLAILLMGIALETVLSALASILILYTPPEMSLSLADWLAGSLFLANWTTVWSFLSIFVIGICGLVVFGRRLPAYDLGNDIALSLGEPVRLFRPCILVFAVLLSSAAVAAVGPLMFLGVIAPRLADVLTRGSGRMRLLIAALVGGILVISADLIGRISMTDIPLPLGLGLTLIGTPLFIVVLRLTALRRNLLN